MKKSFFAVAALCLGFWACGDDSSSANDVVDVASSSSVTPVESSSSVPVVETSSSAVVSSSSAAPAPVESSSSAEIASSSSVAIAESSSSLVIDVNDAIGKLGCEVTSNENSATQTIKMENFTLVTVYTMVEKGVTVDVLSTAESCAAADEVINKYATTDGSCVVAECTDGVRQVFCNFDFEYESVEEMAENLGCEYFTKTE